MRRVKGQQGLNDAFRAINAIDSGVLTNDWYNSIQVQQICIPFQYLFLSLSCNYLNNPRARNIFASSFYLFDLQGILFDESCSDLGCQQVFFKYFFLCLLLLILSFANFFFFGIFLFYYLYFCETVKVFENWNIIRNGGTKYLDSVIITTFEKTVSVCCEQHFPQSGESCRFGWCSVMAWTVDPLRPN